MSSDAVNISFTCNGMLRKLAQIPVDLPLIDLLHEDLGLTGTKFCCGIGICHACVVGVAESADGPLEPLQSCVNPAASVDGKFITTVEGVATAGRLTALQQAFLDHFAFQCGYCTPGFLIAAHILVDTLRRTPIPKDKVDENISAACGAHMCRCTGYVRYYAAIRAVILKEPGLTL